MRRRLTVLAVCLAAYAGWTLAFPSGAWRYRLTFEVETPEGVKTGSAVREVKAATGMRFGDASGTTMRVTGEAVTVDLGARGLLFAVLSRGESVDDGGYIVFRSFPYPGSPNGPLMGVGTREGIAYYERLEARADVPFETLPTLVRFNDIANPRTVELVDPKDLSKSYGAGVGLKSASIEMVDNGIWPLNRFGLTGEPVTAEIEKKLPWLEGHYDLHFDGSQYHDVRNTSLANLLSSGHFRTWRD
jgi:hypothetical protein